MPRSPTFHFLNHQHCIALVLTLSVIGSGCAKGPRNSLSFSATPSWRDEGRIRDTVKTHGTAQANVPVPSKTPADDDSATAADAIGKSRVMVDPPLEAADPPLENTLAGEPAVGQPLRGEAALSDPTHRLASNESPVSDVRIQQLKAALNADVERSVDEREQEATGHPLRVRAESLVRKAEEFLRLGQLAEARRAAQQAVDLTELGRFEFLPTEERPLELLRRIDTAIGRRDAGPAPLESVVGSRIPLNESPSSSAAERPVSAGADEAIPPMAIGWHAPTATENVMVAANRPVIPTPTETDSVRSEEPRDVVLLHPEAEAEADDSTTSPGLLASLGQTSAALPPFRGAVGAGPFTLDGPPLGSPETAPAPPDVEEPVPLPSMPPTATTAAVPLTEVTSTRPMFNGDALLLAAAGLGLICGVTGCGLLIRQFRERI